MTAERTFRECDCCHNTFRFDTDGDAQNEKHQFYCGYGSQNDGNILKIAKPDFPYQTLCYKCIDLLFYEGQLLWDSGYMGMDDYSAYRPTQLTTDNLDQLIADLAKQLEHAKTVRASRD